MSWRWWRRFRLFIKADSRRTRGRHEGHEVEETKVRWTVVWLLFFATTINYVDRAILGVLKPLLETEFGWSQVDYGWIVTSFQVTYAAGYLLGGRLMDRVGVRIGYALSLGLWSLAGMSHAAAGSLAGFCLARGALGLTQGGNFPAAIKAVAEWFPTSQRALATGFFNAGSNIGAVLSPLVAAWLAVQFGWQTAFIATGAVGFIWIAAWWVLYRSPEQHPRVSASELAFIRSDPPDPPVKIPWISLLAYRQTWAYLIGMFLASPIWWFYVFWTPDFLNKRYDLSLTQSSLPLVFIFLVSPVGGIAGGWLPALLLRRGWSLSASRKTTLLVCALGAVPIITTPLWPGAWPAVAIVALGATAHCGYSANLFTLVSDTVPRRAVSSVVGIGGMAGSIGGILFAQAVSRILDYTGNNYFIPFAIGSLAYLVATGLIHLLLPRLQPMEPGSGGSGRRAKTVALKTA
jgi:MFS transporter, ACS family, hexuronate transporter